MDDESVDRILAATRAAPGGDKIDISNVEKAVLRTDIESVNTVHLWATELGPSSSQKERSRRRSKIAEKAGELRKLLEADRADDGAVGLFYPLTLSDYLDVTSNIVLAAERAMEPLRPLTNGDKREFERADEMLQDALTSGSPFEVAIARLIFVYEKHFDCDAGYTKNNYGPSSIPDSPFIRFAEQSLLDLGITYKGQPYSRNTIATAVTHVRKGGRRNLANRSAGASDKL